MKITKEFILREIMGDYIIVPVGKTSMEIQKLITVNETGAFLWKNMQDEFNEDSLTALLLEEYDVTPEQARADVIDYINMLKENNII